MVRGETDQMNVSLALALLSYAPLLRVLRYYGFFREALILDTLLYAHEAWDTRSMCPDEASARIADRTDLLLRLLGNLSFVASSHPGKVSGFTYRQVIRWLTNASIRMCIVKRLSPSQLATHNVRAFGSDANEQVFGDLAKKCGGHKPIARTAIAMFGGIRLLLDERRKTRVQRGYDLKDSQSRQRRRTALDKRLHHGRTASKKASGRVASIRSFFKSK
jgi:hypothetical protein